MKRLKTKTIYMIVCISKKTGQSFVIECFEKKEDASEALQEWKKLEPQDIYYLDKCSLYLE